MYGRVEFECPRCGSSNSVEIDDLEQDSQATDCPHCDAELVVSYSLSFDVDIDDVQVAAAAPAEFECPRCRWEGSVEVSDESGSDEIRCDDCRARLSLVWSEWGRDIRVVVI